MSIMNNSAETISTNPNVHEAFETEKSIMDLVSQLRNLLDDDERMQLGSVDDNFLARFIRGRKFNILRAHRSLKRYLGMKKRRGELVEGLVPTAFASNYKRKFASVLKNRDSQGRQILLLCTSNWNPDLSDAIHELVGAYFILEEMISSADTQLNGIVIIFDCLDFSFSQARHINLKVLRIMLDIVQDTLPVSFQGIHIINHPRAVQFLYSIIKPFMNEKVRQRILFHGNTKSLHKYLDPAILPTSLGGNLFSEEATNNSIIPNLLKKDDYYKDVLSIGMRKTKLTY